MNAALGMFPVLNDFIHFIQFLLVPDKLLFDSPVQQNKVAFAIAS